MRRFSGRLLTAACFIAVGMLLATGCSPSWAAPSSNVAGAATSGWNQQSTPNPRSANGEFEAVSCYATNRCMAAGENDSASGSIAPMSQEWNGSSWVIQSVPAPTSANYSYFVGIACPTANDCIAVGPEVAASDEEPTLAEQWTGSKWYVDAMPELATYASLTAVSCAAVDTCVAVGWEGASPLAESFNGSTWTVESTPEPASSTNASLSGLSCRSATSCIAVGSYSTSSGGPFGLAETWNGSSWKVMKPPAPSGSTTNQLVSVSCPTASRCIAVGSSSDGSNDATALAEEWNGTSWSIQQMPREVEDQMTLHVSCGSASECVATGSLFGSDGYVLGGYVWNGTKWTTSPVIAPEWTVGSGFDGVSCPSAKNCVAVGFNGDGALDESWNGSVWTMGSPGEPDGTLGGSLTAVSCSSADSCMAVGVRGADSGYNATLADIWNGIAWKSESTLEPAGAYNASLDGVSCSKRDSCIAVGFADTESSGLQPLSELWNGKAWSMLSTPNPGNSGFDGVSCTSTTFCIAVGLDYSLGDFSEEWNGKHWAELTTPNPIDDANTWLQAVSCTSEKFCTTAGSFANSSDVWVSFAETWNGKTWSIKDMPDPSGAAQTYLNGISCPTTKTCVAVGWYTTSSEISQSMTEVWNGGTWTVEAPQMPADDTYAWVLYGVSCTAADSCYAAGAWNSGSGDQWPLVEKWNGMSWTWQNVANPPSVPVTALNAVSCTSSCTAVGWFGPLFENGKPLVESD
jgi:hypothetical protein